MPTTQQELEKIADLAYLDMDENTAAQLAQDVSAIMDYVEQLRQINTTNITPMLHPLDLHQALRADAVTEATCLAELESISAHFSDGYYQVPQVIDTGSN